MIRLIKTTDINMVNLSDSIYVVYAIFATTKDEYIVVVNNGQYVGMIYRSFFMRTYKFNEWKNDDTIFSSKCHILHDVCVDTGCGESQIRQNVIKILKRNKGLRVVPILDSKLHVLKLYEKCLQDQKEMAMEFYRKYNYCLINGYSIHDYLLERGWGKINIVGGEDLAVVVYNDLIKGGEIEICYILDHEDRLFGQIRTRTWMECAKDAFEKADASVITYLNTAKVLKYEAVQKNGRNVKDLNEIVDEMYYSITISERTRRIFEELKRREIFPCFLLYPRTPDISRRKTKWEELLTQKAIEASSLRENTLEYKDELIKAFRNEYSFDEIDNDFIHAPLQQRRYHGYSIQKDLNSKYINILCGRRVTVSNSGEIPPTSSKIHVFGKSWVFSKYSEDKNTLCSQLERRCQICNTNYSVINYGVCGLPIEHVLTMIEDKMEKMKSGDRVVFVCNDDKRFSPIFIAKCDGIPLVNGIEIINEYVEGKEVFVDRSHLNQYGEGLLVDRLFDCLFNNNDLYSKIEKREIHYSNLFLEEAALLNTKEYNFEKELEEYLRKLPKPSHNGKVGCIVMNCNPFTNGHKYLVEIAAKEVDELYLFVVEEDKSFFPFEDRYMMVKDGVSEYKNVIAVPSGNFLISSVTFPEYFEKENKPEMVIDVSNDLTIFCEKIAPYLGISVRFAGTEPMDEITRQYNENMKRVLPVYGILFKEISRKEVDGEAISASNVRKLLKERDYLHIKSLVPESTYSFLMEHYGGKDYDKRTD